ncbi:MAG: Phytoene dehydrogenase and related proteins, partial [uncultured Rubrobacteraceae bacterium]
ESYRCRGRSRRPHVRKGVEESWRRGLRIRGVGRPRRPRAHGREGGVPARPGLPGVLHLLPGLQASPRPLS